MRNLRPRSQGIARDPKGKLVVVVDSPDAGALGTTLNTIALLPDVFTASLVFHAIDAGLGSAPAPTSGVTS